MDNAMAELKDEKASLEEEKSRLCEERDYMQSLAAEEKEERPANARCKLEEELLYGRLCWVLNFLLQSEGVI